MSEREVKTLPKGSGRPHLRPVDAESNPGRLHQITFCIECDEAIPVHALTCFHCGAKQPGAERAMPVVFCEKCGEDYPSRAMACHHCGHINPRHPLVKGHFGG